MEAFWMVKNPRTMSMVSEMKELFRQRDFGLSYWREYLTAHSDQMRNWLLDQVGAVLTRICRRVGLLGMLAPATHAEAGVEELFRQAATKLRGRRVAGRLSAQLSSCLTLLPENEVHQLALGQASALITRVAGFCSVPVPLLGEDSAAIQESTGKNVRVREIASWHLCQQEEGRGEAVQTAMGAWVDVHSAIANIG
jgi:hypothetical protein